MEGPGANPPRARRSILGNKNSIPIDLIFGLMLSYQYDRTTTIITPFQFLTTFPRKIQGVADTAEETDMQLKFTFFFPAYISHCFFCLFFFNKKTNDKKKKIKR